MEPNNEAASRAIGLIRAAMTALQDGKLSRFREEIDVLLHDAPEADLRHVAATSAAIAGWALLRYQETTGADVEQVIQQLALTL